MGSLAAPWLVTALLLALTGCVTETIGGSDLTPATVGKNVRLYDHCAQKGMGR